VVTMLSMTVYLRFGAKGLVGESGDYADHDCVPEVWGERSCWSKW
jgi:hypothetical protein